MNPPKGVFVCVCVRRTTAPHTNRCNPGPLGLKCSKGQCSKKSMKAPLMVHYFGGGCGGGAERKLRVTGEISLAVQEGSREARYRARRHRASAIKAKTGRLPLPAPETLSVGRKPGLVTVGSLAPVHGPQIGPRPCRTMGRTHWQGRATAAGEVGGRTRAQAAPVEER